MRLLCSLILILAACQDAPQTSQPNPAEVSPEVSSSSSLPDGDACDLLTADAIQQHIPVASGATINATDLTEAIRYNENARSCTWMWDGHQIGLHVAEKPDRDGNWASGSIAARLTEGYERIDDIGDESAFRADRSELFWQEGGRRTYALTYGGPSPSARIELAPLLALAEEVEG